MTNTTTQRPESGHTPGPWRTDDHGHEYTIESSALDMSATVAVVVARKGSHTGRADARLIAAAPELLAALKAVSETGDDCPICDRGRLRNPEKTHWPECPFGRAQSVIAKAEGRS